ncbi:MAG: EAL and HDOD domain-containing protein [Chloroflexota bacterium]
MAIVNPAVEHAAHDFVARQPIFDAEGAVQAYELLFRSGPLADATETELQQATLQVLDTAFLLHGIQELTGGLPAFLSFSTSTIIDEYPFMFPSEAIAVQLGPGVRFTDSVMEVLNRLARRGYSLVLSDFCAFPRIPVPVLELVDIVKVDCSDVDERRLMAVSKALSGRVIMVAEHLDTQIGWKYAQELGFTLFQGRFLGGAEVIESPDLNTGKFQRLRLLKEMSKEELDPGAVEEIIKRDPGLAYKLMMFVNSAATGLRQPVNSIRQGVMMLGRNGMVRWASVVTLKETGSGRPSELVQQALFRARFCEKVSELASRSPKGGEAFLLGLFAQIDLLIGRPMAELLPLLPLSDEVRFALEGESSALRGYYDLCLAYENADWGYVSELSGIAGITDAALPALYHEALKWSSSLAG